MLNAVLVNVSISGGCLEGPELPDAGETCQLRTEWDGKWLLLSGNVVWKARERVGVKFSILDEEMNKLLRRMCSNMRLEPPARLPF